MRVGNDDITLGMMMNDDMGLGMMILVWVGCSFLYI